MKYGVTFSCGHTETVVLFGPTKDRESKIAWYEKSGVCTNCYRAKLNEKKSAGCTEIEMPYRDYKNKFPECATKTGSYNADKKSIIVYVPIGHSMV